MAVRGFTDSDQVRWEVWCTTPIHRDVLGVEYRAGWLTFESATERRRLAPLPRGWERASIEQLRHYLHEAETVFTRTPPRVRASSGAYATPAIELTTADAFAS